MHRALSGRHYVFALLDPSSGSVNKQEPELVLSPVKECSKNLHHVADHRAAQQRRPRLQRRSAPHGGRQTLQRVYRNFHYRKQTKDQWARDDPAFLVLLSIWLCVSTLGFGLVLDMGVLETLKLLLWVVFVDCIGVGLLISTLMWFISNKYLLKQPSRNLDVEWGYAFDVHLNAFYPLLLILHFLQLFFINHLVVINSEWFLGYFVGNTLWLIAIGYYLYITFLGYNALPFLQNTVVLLYPFALLGLFYVLSISLGWNFTQSLCSFYKFRVK
ncbi:unnamed protein product [Pleuronectes platessa]|uniref:Unc-50-like protein n=1 Tax=Pleuronectes platessa TaxID=8262 RepID=A0A9N7TIB0_PLEPL|nr:unnamed protein product [Pleuronectes platessa]